MNSQKLGTKSVPNTAFMLMPDTTAVPSDTRLAAPDPGCRFPHISGHVSRLVAASTRDSHHSANASV